MLPLHTTFRNLISGSFLITILVSCTNKNPDLKVIRALNESIENSNRSVNASTADLMASLQDKLFDYSTKERAQVWIPKAQLIQKISKDAYDQIHEIKTKLRKDESMSIRKEDVLNVFHVLIRYKNEFLQIDQRLTKDYQRYFKIFTRSIDSTDVNQEDLFKNCFSGTSNSAAIAMLSKLQNNIKLNEYGMITYCHEMSTPIFCGFRNLTQALVVQNTSIVQPKDEIEITAGLASFSTYESPKIFIYNRSVEISEDGAAHYKLKAASRPGKYYIPVKINYTDQDGKQVTIQKEIEYTVANIQKQ